MSVCILIKSHTMDEASHSHSSHSVLVKLVRVDWLTVGPSPWTQQNHELLASLNIIILKSVVN